MHSNQNQARAKALQHSEFYTQYKDIEKEIQAYVEYNPDVFKGKTILCPCDDPATSQFPRYFVDNFDRLGIRELICSSVAPVDDNHWAEGEVRRGRIMRLTSVTNVDPENLPWQYLLGDGDFRSKEVTRLRDEADVVVTNPPIGKLFRQFFTWLTSGKKKFIIIVNINCIGYKDIFPLVMENKVWKGARWHSRDEQKRLMRFEIREKARGRESEILDGKTLVTVDCAGWLTNLPHSQMHRSMFLHSRLDNMRDIRFLSLKDGYQLYCNYSTPIIDVPNANAIPYDWEGVMGVPLTWYEYYNPESWEILGISNERHNESGLGKYAFSKRDGEDYRTWNGCACIMKDGKIIPQYARLLIRRRRFG